MSRKSKVIAERLSLNKNTVNAWVRNYKSEGIPQFKKQIVYKGVKATSKKLYDEI